MKKLFILTLVFGLFVFNLHANVLFKIEKAIKKSRPMLLVQKLQKATLTSDQVINLKSLAQEVTAIRKSKLDSNLGKISKRFFDKNLYMLTSSWFKSASVAIMGAYLLAIWRIQGEVRQAHAISARDVGILLSGFKLILLFAKSLIEQPKTNRSSIKRSSIKKSGDSIRVQQLLSEVA